MFKVFQRVCKWNEARYERVYSSALTHSLLREEYEEFCAAETQVDRLDALCDIIYVAFGGIWKLDEDEDMISESSIMVHKMVMNWIEANTIPLHFIIAYLDMVKYSGMEPDEMILLNIAIYSAMAEMASMGLDPDAQIKALLIVCDSNDSKTIEKTDFDVKANKNKGEFYKAPEPRLKKLLESLNATYH